jgi:hypothetical protein
MSETNTPTLLERLAAIRAANVAANPSPLSDDRTKHSLATFLSIYLKSEEVCGVDYMEKASYLLGFLTHGFSIPLSYELDKYPEILDKSVKIPKLLYTWNLNQLAYIITGKTYGEEFHLCLRALYFTTLAIVRGKI